MLQLLVTSIARYVLTYVFMCLSSPPHLLRPKQNQPNKQLKISIHRLYELYKTTPPSNSPLISKKVTQLKTCSTCDSLPMKWCLLFIILQVLVEYNSFQNLNISIYKISMSIKGDLHWPEGPSNQQRSTDSTMRTTNSLGWFNPGFMYQSYHYSVSLRK